MITLELVQEYINNFYKSSPYKNLKNRKVFDYTILSGGDRSYLYIRFKDESIETARLESYNEWYNEWWRNERLELLGI